eukprot:SAG31_NODE_1477_length_8194_cov_21.653490_2_plen_465_part_00
MPIDALEKHNKSDLVVALHRLGNNTNEHPIVSKPLHDSKDKQHTGRRSVNGWIRFYAPKGTGRFVFRIYSTTEIIATLATSNVFAVEIAFQDVVPTLKFLLAQMKDKRTAMTALQQMPLVIKALPYPQKAGGPWGNLLWDGIRLAQKLAVTAEAETEAALAKSRLSPEELAERLRTQIEYYFSDANWPNDKYLQTEASKDPEGFLPLRLVAGFKKVRELSECIPTIHAALAFSPSLILRNMGADGRVGLRARADSDLPWQRPTEEELEAWATAASEETQPGNVVGRIKEQVTAKRRAKNVHVRVRAILLAAQQSRGVCEKLLSGPRIEQLREWQATYCPFAKRFFTSREELLASYESLSFVPDATPLPPLDTPGVDTLVLNKLAEAMNNIMVETQPDQQFYDSREGLRRRVEEALIRAQVVPPGARLKVFGSSANNFGTKCVTFMRALAACSSGRNVFKLCPLW